MQGSGHLFMQVVSRVWFVGLLAALMLSLGPVSGSTQQATSAPGSANPDYQGALPWEIPDDGETMIVHKVVDGDTLHLTYPHGNWYYPTRLIGIQAPETEGPYTRKECYGPEASQFLRDLLPIGAEVIVQRDITDEDRNGRRLRHVFLVEPGTDDAYLLSEILVLGGFAEARDYPPDDLYDGPLADAERAARSERAGLWKSCATGVYLASGNRLRMVSIW